MKVFLLSLLFAAPLSAKMKFSGYLQAQFVDDERAGNFDQFSVRRGRVKFTYQATPSSRFVLQPDVTSSGVTLKDGYVEFTWRNHALTAGQFNWPYGFEIMYSSSSREVPERSRVVRTLFPGERDRGVMLSGRALGDRLHYRVAIVNGTGTAQPFDTNKRKDLVGRVGYSFGALDAGASAYRGSEVAGERESEKDRTGADFQWKTPVRGLVLRGEYIAGKQQSRDVDGWYFYAIQNAGTRHQFAVRIDEYESILTVNPAYSFQWDAHSKVMVSYESIGTDVKDNVFTVRYQYSF